MHILNLNPLEPLLSVSSVYVQASPLHHRIFFDGMQPSVSQKWVLLQNRGARLLTGITQQVRPLTQFYPRYEAEKSIFISVGQMIC